MKLLFSLSTFFVLTTFNDCVSILHGRSLFVKKFDIAELLFEILTSLPITPRDRCERGETVWETFPLSFFKRLDPLHILKPTPTENCTHLASP